MKKTLFSYAVCAALISNIALACENCEKCSECQNEKETKCVQQEEVKEIKEKITLIVSSDNSRLNSDNGRAYISHGMGYGILARPVYVSQNRLTFYILWIRVLRRYACF